MKYASILDFNFSIDYYMLDLKEMIDFEDEIYFQRGGIVMPEFLYNMALVVMIIGLRYGINDNDVIEWNR